MITIPVPEHDAIGKEDFQNLKQALREGWGAILDVDGYTGGEYTHEELQVFWDELAPGEYFKVVALLVPELSPEWEFSI